MERSFERFERCAAESLGYKCAPIGLGRRRKIACERKMIHANHDNGCGYASPLLCRNAKLLFDAKARRSGNRVTASGNLTPLQT